MKIETKFDDGDKVYRMTDGRLYGKGKPNIILCSKVFFHENKLEISYRLKGDVSNEYVKEGNLFREDEVKNELFRVREERINKILKEHDEQIELFDKVVSDDKRC